MVRRDNRTYRTAQRAHARVLDAQRELEAEAEPMRRYTYPIPQPAPGLCPASEEDLPTAMTQVLEQLACQNQLLMDLLGAVNSLTAALLCRNS
ncbi:hypothetical protein AAEU42_01235 [Pseudoflavonifractor phocaeensis]|uniref:hypothetical protein n=1 Tax=Pseudoflavonifractor phocaeensis TaxID=1870988 RepID=UPI0030913B8C|nr:hypothetical protein CE91St43_07210 [Oscillospiraceae bacterium]